MIQWEYLLVLSIQYKNEGIFSDHYFLIFCLHAYYIIICLYMLYVVRIQTLLRWKGNAPEGKRIYTRKIGIILVLNPNNEASILERVCETEREREKEIEREGELTERRGMSIYNGSITSLAIRIPFFTWMTMTGGERSLGERLALPWKVLSVYKGVMLFLSQFFSFFVWRNINKIWLVGWGFVPWAHIYS